MSSDCEVAGKTIRDSNIRQVSGALILAAEDHEDRVLVNPGPDVTLRVGDRLVIVDTRGQVTKTEEILRPRV